jgi:transposase
MNDTIGIDISKDTLDAHRLSDGTRLQFGNDSSGLGTLRRWIGKVPVRVVYEATGRYHRDLEAALEPGGHALVKVNPARARRFAQAIGQGAKTDRVDAAMLARMGAVLDLEAKPVRSCSMHEIRELHVARIGLVKDRTACRNRLHGARNKVVLAQLRARLKQVEKQIEQIDAELLRLIAGDPQLARRLEILTSVPGIGRVAAAAMIVEMPELGSMDGKEAASLAGLPRSPVSRASGRGNPGSAAADINCDGRSTCPRWSPFATTGSSAKSTRPSVTQENPRKLPSQQSCASSSSSPTL